MMHIIGLNEAALRCIQLLGVTPLRGKKTQGSKACGGVVEKNYLGLTKEDNRFQQS
jgi:hypothetical protein